MLGTSFGTTRLDKLLHAVTSRLPRTWSPRKVEEYVLKVEAITTAAWKVFGQVCCTKLTNIASESKWCRPHLLFDSIQVVLKES